MLFRRKIPCYVLVFDQVEIIKQSLASLAKHAGRLDLIVLENPSPNTPKIKKIVDDLGKKGLVKKHYLFDENITSTAYDIVITEDLKTLAKNKFVIITDGDLTCKDYDWVTEEIQILKQHKDVFACGVTLDRSNLPLKAFPSAKDFIPPDIREYPDFYEVTTGGHLLMFRGKQFAAFMRWKNENDLRFVDGQIHRFCYEVLNKKWARTKKAVAYHLTWDLYADKNHPYTKLKTTKSFQETWYHDRRAAYTLTTY